MTKYRVVFLLILLFSACGNSPDDAVNGVLSSLKDGDYESLLKYWPALNAEIGDMTMSEVEEMMPAQTDLEWEIKEVDYSLNGNNATVNVEISGLNQEESTSSVEVLCEKSRDGWVVTEVQWGVSDSAYQNACRANMRTIASQEEIFYATAGHYTPSLLDMNIQGIECPLHGRYDIESDGQSFLISCPGGHGSIEDGIFSWSAE